MVPLRRAAAVRTGPLLWIAMTTTAMLPGEVRRRSTKSGFRQESTKKLTYTLPMATCGREVCRVNIVFHGMENHGIDIMRSTTLRELVGLGCPDELSFFMTLLLSWLAIGC